MKLYCCGVPHEFNVIVAASCMRSWRLDGRMLSYKKGTALPYTTITSIKKQATLTKERMAGIFYSQRSRLAEISMF